MAALNHRRGWGSPAPCCCVEKGLWRYVVMGLYDFRDELSPFPDLGIFLHELGICCVLDDSLYSSLKEVHGDCNATYKKSRNLSGRRNAIVLCMYWG